MAPTDSGASEKLGNITVTETTPEFRSALVDRIPHLRAYARSLARNRDRADDLVHARVRR
jgi:RNA polymerase sigma-70 factor, ECF subfamily